MCRCGVCSASPSTLRPHGERELRFSRKEREKVRSPGTPTLPPQLEQVWALLSTQDIRSHRTTWFSHQGGCPVPLPFPLEKGVQTSSQRCHTTWGLLGTARGCCGEDIPALKAGWGQKGPGRSSPEYQQQAPTFQSSSWDLHMVCGGLFPAKIPSGPKSCW